MKTSPRSLTCFLVRPRRISLWLTSLLLASLFLSACDDFERNTYRTLKLAKVEYELLQEQAARAYLGSRITQEQWDRFAIAGNRFIAAHTLAADLTKTYQQSRAAASADSDALRRQVTAAMANLPVLLADLHSLLVSFEAPPSVPEQP